ncbi:hypothetical protein GPM19_08940 [Halomonas sp. ZH2S]|uniref:Uncharacterized protein n=1 Tax=Vreelandella zhuhanensis TaxID=2684210 RepID=A0A7X3H2A2_9GAMM|nr:hypothetical protein [Halomonas zhuhanensis]MWJ28328.1 hypothetical protein [Halomonas zhuhanensis]
MIEGQLSQLVATIKGHHEGLDATAKLLRTPEKIDSFDKWNHDCWCCSVFGDSLVRLRLFTGNNFHVVETLGVISVSRYIFELSVWLRLFELNSRYGLVYYEQLIETQLRYWRDYRAQIDREISLLSKFAEEESSLLSEKMTELDLISDEQRKQEVAIAIPKIVAASIDRKAARHFSIYAEQAKTNGYGFQAHLVEKKVLPGIEQSIAELEKEKITFDTSISKDIRTLIPKRWNWRQMAEKVDLAEEYDFIYTFSSKLLHATPASITTTQKNLELDEMIVFLKYIDVKIRDLLELSQSYV